MIGLNFHHYFQKCTVFLYFRVNVTCSSWLWVNILFGNVEIVVLHVIIHMQQYN